MVVLSERYTEHIRFYPEGSRKPMRIWSEGVKKDMHFGISLQMCGRWIGKGKWEASEPGRRLAGIEERK